MYSNKGNVNILTALLVSHGVHHAVVCPGSRNAPIAHNLDTCPDITCHPVTDERSAGFYALGMAQALHAPVAVCVTSGTALLNLQPAVAEAWYQHQPLIVISADRPQQWIDQLDGQTLPQPDALGRFVRKAVSLPEVSEPDTQHWHCNRLVNEALLAVQAEDARPVHINVPITEPLFGFDVAELPKERVIVRSTLLRDYDSLPLELVEGLVAARRPVIVFGQTNPNDFGRNDVDYLFSHVIVLHESMSDFPHVSHFDEVLALDTSTRPLPPDFIIFVGDAVVSKRLKHFLRQAEGAVTWRISRSDRVEDTFMNLRGIIVGDAEYVLQSINQKISFRKMAGMKYRRQWLSLLSSVSRVASEYLPAYSQMATVKYLEEQLSSLRSTTPGAATLKKSPFPSPIHVHYANSSAIRLSNIYACHHVWCNRGVNGIEGSLSTAAGFSCVTRDRVLCVIGDLSFFYDQNALWNQNLWGNLRFLLLNNGKGGIFGLLPGLEQSSAHERIVAAAHDTSAEGICHQNRVEYKKAENMAEMQQGIDWLLNTDSTRPLLLEVHTDAATDNLALQQYFMKLGDGEIERMSKTRN